MRPLNGRVPEDRLRPAGSVTVLSTSQRARLRDQRLHPPVQRGKTQSETSKMPPAGQPSFGPRRHFQPP